MDIRRGRTYQSIVGLMVLVHMSPGIVPIKKKVIRLTQLPQISLVGALGFAISRSDLPMIRRCLIWITWY